MVIQTLILAAVTILLVLNILASFRCLRFVLSPKTERISQLCLVWAIPMIGALIVLHMLRTGDDPSPGTYSADLGAVPEVVSGAEASFGGGGEGGH